MLWVISEFSDLTVSSVCEKWLRKNDRKCWFPKTNVLSKIKNQADVDTKSGKWSLHPCRLLMKGERFATYAKAREAENIAQNHSTMTSFQNSFLAKQEARKHPMVYDSSSENESKDFKHIKKLAKLDSGFAMNKDKEYSFNRKDNGNHSVPLDQSLNIDNDLSFVSGGSGSPEKGDDQSVVSGSTNRNSNRNSSDTSDDDCDDWHIECGSTNRDLNDNSSDDSYEHSSDIDIFSEDENLGDKTNDDDKGQSTVNESNFLPNMDHNLESTEQLPSPESGYDFNEDRRLVRLEKLVTHACQELEVMKTDIKEMKKNSSGTESALQNMSLICKDLSVEVFACTEEIKKRNGMFTDVLVPDIKLPVKRTKQYDCVELALKRHKIVDNLIKYLASTINETKEKQFIRKCFSVIFGLKYFCLKVWWKKMPCKVNIKNSQILHCMIESFKIKFGLVEPKKTDKEIDRLIYKIGRNIKDSWRKTRKKNEDEVAGEDEDDWNAMQRNGCRRKRGTEEKVNRHENAEANENSEDDTRTAEEVTRAAKEAKQRKDERKAEREEAKRAAEEVTRAAEEVTRAAEENAKKAKKAAKKARKAKQAAEALAAEQATRAAEEEAQQREHMPESNKRKTERNNQSESKAKKKKGKKE